jgi:hypothetical protein
MSQWSTDFLFAQPSLASGAGSALDLWGIFDAYNISASGQEADSKSLLNDWYLVGRDLESAMRDVPKKK